MTGRYTTAAAAISADDKLPQKTAEAIRLNELEEKIMELKEENSNLRSEVTSSKHTAAKLFFELMSNVAALNKKLDDSSSNRCTTKNNDSLIDDLLTAILKLKVDEEENNRNLCMEHEDTILSPKNGNKNNVVLTVSELIKDVNQLKKELSCNSAQCTKNVGNVARNMKNDIGLRHMINSASDPGHLRLNFQFPLKIDIHTREGPVADRDNGTKNQRQENNISGKVTKENAVIQTKIEEAAAGCDSMELHNGQEKVDDTEHAEDQVPFENYEQFIKEEEKQSCYPVTYTLPWNVGCRHEDGVHNQFECDLQSRTVSLEQDIASAEAKLISQEEQLIVMETVLQERTGILLSQEEKLIEIEKELVRRTNILANVVTKNKILQAELQKERSWCFDLYNETQDLKLELEEKEKHVEFLAYALHRIEFEFMRAIQNDDRIRVNLNKKATTSLAGESTPLTSSTSSIVDDAARGNENPHFGKNWNGQPDSSDVNERKKENDDTEKSVADAFFTHAISPHATGPPPSRHEFKAKSTLGFPFIVFDEWETNSMMEI